MARGTITKVLCHFFLLYHLVLASPEVSSLNVNHEQFARSLEATQVARRASGPNIADSINLVESTMVRQQGATAEFLLIALGRTTLRNFFLGSLASIEANLHELTNGSATVLLPPTTEISDRITVIWTEWERFKSIVETSVQTVTNESTAVLNATESENEILQESLGTLLQLYESYASLIGSPVTPRTKYAFRLRILGEIMSKECLFIALGVQREKYMEDLPLLEQQFDQILDSQTWGNLVLGIPRMDEVCLMHSMYAVSSTWYEFKLTLQDVRTVVEGGGFVGADLVNTFISRGSALVRVALVRMLAYYDGNGAPCDIPATMSQADWQLNIDMANRLRRLMQQASRLFFQVLKDGADELNQLMLSQALRDVETSVSNVYAGSYTHDQPPPPTQTLIQIVASVYDHWITFQRSIERNVNSGMLDVGEIKNHAQAITALAARLAAQSYALDDLLLQFSQQLVQQSLLAQPGLRSVIWQLSEEMSVLAQSLAKEAIIIYLGDTARGKTGRFDAIANGVEANHHELLMGSASSSVDPQVGVPRTVDACTLVNMAQVKVDFQALKAILIQLYGSKDFLSDHLGFITAEAANPVLATAFLAFKAGWDSFRATDELRKQDLQIAYIYSNPNAVGSKDNLDFAPGPESYHTAHRDYHPTYRDILYARNYYDIFIFDMEGNLIYSVYKELDYATNFMANGTGEWKDSGLGEAFRAAVQHPDIINVIDWKPYGPSYGALASFLSTGILQDGNLLGVFCTQMPPESKPVQVSEMEPYLEKAVSGITTAIDYYKTGSGSCTTTLTPTEWEITLEQLSRLEYKFEKTKTEYALMANGYSQSWLNISVQGLEEQKQFTETEASKLELVAAMWAFKQAWDKYRDTNAERLLSLQIAYILLNPFPTGEKDKLDYADGSEEYHQVHREYHPIYRAILYERNYYDIFFLDLGGNCIYSVYKELDYATNFLASGPGEWKDSGLGEAFRAAVRNPDGINVIDWAPYGPSAGALASFLSTGIRRFGELIGVFCTQLPPEFTPRNSTTKLRETLQDLNDLFVKFKYGVPAEQISPPSTQFMSWKLFNASDLWETLSPQLATNPNKETLKSIMDTSGIFVDYAAQLNEAVLDVAYAQSPSISGAKIQLASKQLTLLQHIQRDCVLIALGGYDSLRTHIPVLMAHYEENMRILFDGNTMRRLSDQSRSLAMTDIPATESFEGDTALKTAQAGYNAAKPMLEAFITAATASAEELKNVVEAMDTAIDSALAAANYFSTTTRTTTMLTLEILAPMPLTGDWAGGQTFRLAARLAEGIINEDQLLLPGYQLRHAIFDDKCDASVGSDVVVSANSEKDSYVAIGGMGCDSVCRQVSSLAVSMRLPFLSYECAAAEFSDTNAYPALARLGTVTTPSTKVIRELGTKYNWNLIYIVYGDQAKYQDQATGYATTLESEGFRTQLLNADADKWTDITAIMDTIKGQTKGLQRVLYVMGEETYFRKLICASITQGLQRGIVWLSRGTWRHEWWKKSDLLTSAHRQWLREDVSGKTLRDAFQAFKAAWDAVSPDAATTRQRLFDLYVTDQKDNLDFAEGPERYHSVHQEWHSTYRSKLYARGYYDIFMFDLNGDLIYSVFKETDYATNFLLEGDGAWKDSGLGEAFRSAFAAPDNITYIDWKPYGPSGFADAAFFATGLRDEDGVLIGVYSIQLPPEYERSIEAIQPACSFAALTDAFEGAINVGGLGESTAEFKEKPLPCFKGYSPVSFMSLIHRHFELGYPAGDQSTQVPSPYFEIAAQAVDGACALAFAIQYLLQQGYTVQQVQQPTQVVYERMNSFIRTEMDFQGVSGRVKFNGNNKEGLLAVRQVRGGSYQEVGLVDSNSTITWSNNGTTDVYWQVEPAEAVELAWILPLAVSMAVCAPCLIGCWAGYRLRASWRQQQQEKQTSNQK